MKILRNIFFLITYKNGKELGELQDVRENEHFDKIIFLGKTNSAIYSYKKQRDRRHNEFVFTKIA